MLASVAILILGPLGGISAAFMNFSIGMFGVGIGMLYTPVLVDRMQLAAVLWWTAGGVGASLFDVAQAKRAARRPQPENGELPTDMSTMSLVGGGLIAGDSLAALSVGVYGLLQTVL